MIKLIPQPQQFTIVDDKTFSFECNMNIECKEDINIAIHNLINYLSKNNNIELGIDTLNASIIFVYDDSIYDEGFVIDIQNKVLIKYKDNAGALYAVECLKQLICNYNNKIPHLNIIDYPKLKYRGFMLDSGRYYQKPYEIYKFIDLMLIHRLNYFHWHLTEDQGFRIEIDSYPLLHKKGSYRSHTNFNSIPHSGYYTKDDIRAIVKYANERNITIIPEFDIPGHTRSLIACYPELSCFNRDLPVATHWGVKHDILCVGKESTYTIVKAIIDELCDLFPGEYFHLGGDEAVKTRWKLCPNCQAKMKELGLSDENQLQAYFLNEIAEYLQQKGKKVIIWNEVEDTKICNKNIIWMTWNATKDIFSRLDRDNRKFINASSLPYYLDLPYYKDNTLEKVYNYEPTSEVKNIDLFIGAQASLWTEFVPNFKKAMNMAIPRLSAFSERAWSNKKDYNLFMKNISIHYNFLESNGYHNMKKISRCNSKFYGLLEHIWFGRRVFCWEGLHNEIDNAKVAKKHKSKK